MAELSVSIQIAAQAGRVWELVGDFNGLPKWHPAVESSVLEEEGRVRQLSIVGGGEAREQLEGRDEEARELAYSLLEGLLPVTDYRAILRVTSAPDPGECTVEWRGAFDPVGVSHEQACEILRNIYLAGLENLKNLLEP